MEDESTESAKARTLSQQLHKRNQRQKNRRKKRAAKRNEGEEEQQSLGEQPSDEMVTDYPSTDDAGTSHDAVETDHVNKTGSTEVNQFEAKNILNSEDSSKICETGSNTEIKIENDKSTSNADATLQCLNEFSMNTEVTSQYLSKPSTPVTARKAEGVTTLKTDGPIVITPSQGKSTVPYNWLDCTMPLDDEDLCSSTKRVLADQTTTAVALPVVGNDTADTLPVVESDTADTFPVNTTNTMDTLPAEGSSIADKLPVGEANITDTVSDGEANTADTVSVDVANTADTVSGGEANTAETVSVDEGNDADIIPVGEANTAETLAVGVADTAATFAVDETNTGDESAVGGHNIPEAPTVHEANTADTLPVSVARTTDTLAVGKTRALANDQGVHQFWYDNFAQNSDCTIALKATCAYDHFKSLNPSVDIKYLEFTTSTTRLQPPLKMSLKRTGNKNKQRIYHVQPTTTFSNPCTCCILPRNDQTQTNTTNITKFWGENFTPHDTNYCTLKHAHQMFLKQYSHPKVTGSLFARISCGINWLKSARMDTDGHNARIYYVSPKQQPLLNANQTSSALPNNVSLTGEPKPRDASAITPTAIPAPQASAMETRSIVVDTILIDDNTAANKLQTDKSGSTVKNTITIVDSDDEVEETGSSTQIENSASNLNKESLNTPDLVEMENSRVNPVTTESTTKEKKDKDDGDTAQPITKDLFRLSTRVHEFELALRDKDQVIASLKERISKHQEQQRQEKEVMKERKKLIEDMNSLTEHNQRLEAEISKLKKEREQYPKMPSQNFRTAIVNQVDQCKKLVAALQEELDACKKNHSNQSKTSSSSETLKRKTPNEQLTTSGKKHRQELVPAYVVWRLQLKNHRGVPGNVDILSNHTVKFGGLYSTVSASAVVMVPRGKKAWYEVQYTHIGTEGKQRKQVVGWATPEFSKDNNVTHIGVGDSMDSMGFDPFHAYAYRGKYAKWGKRLTDWGGKGGYIGVAADMVKGTVLFSLNGVWMGVAFNGIAKHRQLFPAFSGVDATLQVNLGDKEFTYGPPDATFQGLAYAIA